MKSLRILAIVTAIADTALNPSEDTSQASMLQTRTGQSVELRLKSGEKISGKIAFVGQQVVHLDEL